MVEGFEGLSGPNILKQLPQKRWNFLLIKATLTVKKVYRFTQYMYENGGTYKNIGSMQKPFFVVGVHTIWRRGLNRTGPIVTNPASNCMQPCYKKICSYYSIIWSHSADFSGPAPTIRNFWDKSEILPPDI